MSRETRNKILFVIGFIIVWYYVASITVISLNANGANWDFL